VVPVLGAAAAGALVAAGAAAAGALVVTLSSSPPHAAKMSKNMPIRTGNVTFWNFLN